MRRSWKTTTAGILMLISAICSAGASVMDDQPETVPNLVEIVAAIAGLGLLAARDNDITDHEAEADKARMRRQDRRMQKRGAGPLPLFVSAAVLATFAVGCANVPSVMLSGDRAATSGTPASVARLTANGEITAGYQGVPPTAAMQDAEGTWVTTPGQGAIITLNPKTNQMYLWSPKDTKITKLKITADGITADAVEANLSTVAKVYADQFAMAMDAIKGMTQTEATRYVEAMQAAGSITSDLAKVITESVIPLLRQ